MDQKTIAAVKRLPRPVMGTPDAASMGPTTLILAHNLPRSMRNLGVVQIVNSTTHKKAATGRGR